MAKWVDAGENRAVDILFGAQAVDPNTYLGIYTDTTEPAETANLPTQTNPITELSGTGYARKTLARGSWTITGDYAQFAQQTFTAGAGGWANCYGYFIASSSDNTGKLLCVEHFSGGPYNVPEGGSIKITPKVTCA